MENENLEQRSIREAKADAATHFLEQEIGKKAAKRILATNKNTTSMQLKLGERLVHMVVDDDLTAMPEVYGSPEWHRSDDLSTYMAGIESLTQIDSDAIEGLDKTNLRVKTRAAADSLIAHYGGQPTCEFYANDKEHAYVRVRFNDRRIEVRVDDNLSNEPEVRYGKRWQPMDREMFGCYAAKLEKGLQKRAKGGETR